MNYLATLCFLYFSVASAFSFPLQLEKFQHSRQNGTDYISLREFANIHGLRLRGPTKEGEILLTNSYTTLSFVAKTVKSEINGVGVALSHPVLEKNGACYISSLDMQATVFPLLFPSRTSGKGKMKVICIDPGHGGKDPGNITGHIQEKEHTLALAREVSALLRKADFKVITTRTSDKYIERSDRTDMANRNKADLFLSLHFNSAPSREVKGIEVYCLTPVGASSTNARGEGANARASRGNYQNSENVFLAYQVQKALINRLPTDDRSVRRARFEVLRDVGMPAILIESGYMSNNQEGKNLTDPKYIRQLAQAIVDGILSYKRIMEG
jgi:N-acetylmuramoyl-L-alanine amidase